MIYAINLGVVTKYTDRYDKVSVNKYPIIVHCENIQELHGFLSNESTKKYIEDNIKLKHLVDSAVFFIRDINGTEYEWNVVDLFPETEKIS